MVFFKPFTLFTENSRFFIVFEGELNSTKLPYDEAKYQYFPTFSVAGWNISKFIRRRRLRLRAMTNVLVYIIRLDQGL